MAKPTTDAEAERKSQARIKWDEENLAANEEWHRLHPVTMKIDEPKTPYNWDEGEYPPEDDEHGGDHHEKNSTWADTHYNRMAAQARLTAPQVEVESTVVPPPTTEAPDAPPRKQRIAVISTAPVDEEEAKKREEKQQEVEFRHMRKAVYADEGAKFKALLASKAKVEDDEEGDEEI